MSPNQVVVRQISLGDNKNFASAQAALEHAATNVATFWLDYASKSEKEKLRFPRLSDCDGQLVESEWSRVMYSDITVAHGFLANARSETARLAHIAVREEFESGHYPEVRDRLVEMQKNEELLLLNIRVAFRKQM